MGKSIEKIFLQAALALLFTTAHSQVCEMHFSKNVKFSNGEMYFTSPVLEHVSFLKTIRQQFTGYYLSIKNTGRFSRIRPKGVVVVLGDGSEINRQTYRIEKELDRGHTFGEGKYQFSAFLPLSLDEINRISAVGITNFKLSVHEYSLSTAQQKLVKQRAACMISIN